MKVLLRNFLVLFRRFRLAMTLNVLGLSVAFTTFMVILMQWQYDMDFDKETPNSERIFRVDRYFEDGTQQAVFARPFAELLSQASPHIEGVALRNAFGNTVFFLLDDGQGEQHGYQETMISVSPSFPKVFSFKMLEGSADVLNEPNQVLTPASMARKFFGNESAVGKRLNTDFLRFVKNGVYYVGGVFEDFPANTSVSNTLYCSFNNDNKTAWNNWNYNFYILLDDPASAEGMEETMIAYAQRMNSDMEAWAADNIIVTPLRDLHFRTNAIFDNTPKAERSTVILLFTIAWVVLIIAAINFTNFSTALAPVRMRCINTQRVLGCTVGEMRRALIGEAVIISFSAYLFSLFWLYLFGKSSLVSLVATPVAITDQIGLVLLTALISVGIGIAAGAYPAYYMTSFQPALVLKGAFGLSPAGRRLRSLLLGFQFVASFALIIGALFMFLQNRYTQKTSLGYDKDALVLADLSNKTRGSREAVKSSLAAIPGVEGVTFSRDILSGSDDYMKWGRDFKGEYVDFVVLPVDYTYLRTLGISVEQGRDFLASDAREGRDGGSLIMNHTAAQQYGIGVGDVIEGMPVVGIIPDIHFASMRREIGPMAFLAAGSYWYSPNYLYIKLHPGTDLFAARDQIASVLSSFDPDYPFDLRFYDTVLENLYQSERSLGTLVFLFSLLAIFISIVGVFGLVVFDSEYKRKEIGIRKVMGATTQEILWMFNRSYLRMLSICFVIATPLAWYAVHAWLQNFAYKTPMYVWVYAAAFVIVALITIATVTYQNWRAANANPVESIKTE